MKHDFHSRFSLPVPADDAQRRFVNRALNLLLDDFLDKHTSSSDRHRAYLHILTFTGDRYAGTPNWDRFIGYDFLKCLQCIEGLYDYWHTTEGLRKVLDELIARLLDESEMDLGVKWAKGRFLPSGAAFLDEALVNRPLEWLREPRYRTVLEPFTKGLDHFLHSVKRPELLPDVITDMYEALEAMAQIITERPGNDLSANREVFIARVKASQDYKLLLKDYIEYANTFRHAAQEGNRKPSISRGETESFVYLTGLFLRLATVRCG